MRHPNETTEELLDELQAHFQLGLEKCYRLRQKLGCVHNPAPKREGGLSVKELADVRASTRARLTRGFNQQ